MVGGAYLKEFRQKVLTLHDTSDKTCHWTSADDLTDEGTPVLGETGPCKCPKATPCKPHNGSDCETTKEVLDKHPDSEAPYSKKLDKLAEWMNVLEKELKGLDELYDNLTEQENLSPAEALNDSTMGKAAKGVYGSKTKELLNILKLKVKKGPNPGGIKKGYCECFENKKSRLKAEKALIQKLMENAQTASDALLNEYAEKKPKFSNTLGPVLKGSLQVVGGIWSGQYGEALKGAKELAEKYQKDLAEGGRCYVFLRAVHAVGIMKKITMLGVIFHDQQWMSVVCFQEGSEGVFYTPPDEEEEPVSDDPPEEEEGSSEEVPYHGPSDEDVPH